IIGNPSLNHRYRKGFYSLFKTLQQNPRLYTLVFSTGYGTVTNSEQHVTHGKRNGLKTKKAA
ncbi:hypothetical protein M2M34_13020, partial [Enterococcus faecalis]|uniref:hypothetical protein n=2 Tax=Enterococcus faecalis TaxID=1351 RepID=UPI0022419677